MKLCLVVNFRYYLKVLLFWNFPKLPKACYFLIRFSVLWHYGLMNLKVVKSGSPWLHITKSGLKRQKSKPHMCGLLVPDES